MSDKIVTKDQLDAYLKRVNETVRASYLQWDKFSKNAEERVPKITYTLGKRYAKLIADDRSAFGFVDLTNGDVLKANSWASPARNFARGNIYDQFGGVGRVRWTSIS